MGILKSVTALGPYCCVPRESVTGISFILSALEGRDLLPSRMGGSYLPRITGFGSQDPATPLLAPRLLGREDG